MNRWLADEIKNDNRFYGFGVIDCERRNVTDQVREIYELGLNVFPITAQRLPKNPSVT